MSVFSESGQRRSRGGFLLGAEEEREGEDRNPFGWSRVHIIFEQTYKHNYGHNQLKHNRRL